MAKNSIGSSFGMRESTNGRTMHYGQDAPAPVGSPIYTQKDLVVEKVTTQNGFGNVVYARDTLGTRYIYAHLDSVPDNVKPGTSLPAGSQVAYSGISGTEKDGHQTSTGAHLHYEVRQNISKNNPDGTAIDPVTTIDPQTGKPYINNVSWSPESNTSIRNTKPVKDPNYTPNGTARAPLRSGQDPSGRTPTPRSLKPDANQTPAETNRLNNQEAPPPGIRAPLINPLLQLGDR